MDNQLKNKKFYKVLFIGSSGIGKTRLINFINTGELKNTTGTYGIEHVYINNFCLIDTPGIDRMITLVSDIVKRSDIIIIIADSYIDFWKKFSLIQNEKFLFIDKSINGIELDIKNDIGNKDWKYIKFGEYNEKLVNNIIASLNKLIL